MRKILATSSKIGTKLEETIDQIVHPLVRHTKRCMACLSVFVGSGFKPMIQKEGRVPPGLVIFSEF